MGAFLPKDMEKARQMGVGQNPLFFNNLSGSDKTDAHGQNIDTPHGHLLFLIWSEKILWRGS